MSVHARWTEQDRLVGASRLHNEISSDTVLIYFLGKEHKNCAVIPWVLLCNGNTFAKNMISEIENILIVFFNLAMHPLTKS